MTTDKTTEYINALIHSQRLGHQVAAHDYQRPRPPRLESPCEDLHPAVVQGLQGLGINKLFSHQARAIEHIRQGRHTVVATPTASGKSLIYNLAFLDLFAGDPLSRGLYIFPLKALTQDQRATFQQWSQAMPLSSLAQAAIYDGDTNAYQRKKIRTNPPAVVMTNPEMIHLALLPYHDKWGDFFSQLKMVVIDEVHTYRGNMGAHMCQVFRRLRRVCRYYGSFPTFVLLSATLANADQLASRLTGLDVVVVHENGAPRGGMHRILMDPMESPARTAILLLKAAMARGLRTIVYTQSRKLAELITLWVHQKAGLLAGKIGVYRAGLLPEERRRIEADLKSGRLLTVVSTSALELGIDIGDLDICILVGYPGSMIATRQRSGRVGRKGQEAAAILIAGQDAMDQYFVRNPQAFFEGPLESAVVNPHNGNIVGNHLVCAAAEMPLADDEPWLTDAAVRTSLVRQTISGELMRTDDGRRYYARRKRPHLNVDLRSVGGRYRIMCGTDPLGEIDAHRLYHETHPGAVYIHLSRTFQVVKVDESTCTVQVQPAKVGYHTRVRNDIDISIIKIEDHKYIGNTNVYYGRLKVTDQVLGYEKVSTTNGRIMGRYDLDLPPMAYETEGFWCVLGSSMGQRLQATNHDVLGSLHAAEHGTIGIMPLLILADRNDIGGLATPLHHQTHGATIFFYDGIPEGGGLCRSAFDRARQLIETARATIESCPCDEGCPACVHSPKCGSGNHPMDKQGGAALLHAILNEPRRPERSRAIELPPEPPIIEKAPVPPKTSALRYGVFDLETQRSAQEVGGWHMAHKMKVSCGVVYDAGDDTYAVYRESQVDALVDHLKQMDLVVGFNSKRFDYRVLTGYSDFDFGRLNSLDLLEIIHQQLGFRLSLDHLAEQTLNAQKSGSGLDALKWWKEGDWDRLIAYCRKDVMLTRDLFRFGRDQGYLIYRQRDGDRFRIPLPGLKSL